MSAKATLRQTDVLEQLILTCDWTCSTVITNNDDMQERITNARKNEYYLKAKIKKGGGVPSHAMAYMKDKYGHPVIRVFSIPKDEYVVRKNSKGGKRSKSNGSMNIEDNPQLSEQLLNLLDGEQVQANALHQPVQAVRQDEDFIERDYGFEFDTNMVKEKGVVHPFHEIYTKYRDERLYQKYMFVYTKLPHANENAWDITPMSYSGGSHLWCAKVPKTFTKTVFKDSGNTEWTIYFNVAHANNNDSLFGSMDNTHIYKLRYNIKKGKVSIIKNGKYVHDIVVIGGILHQFLGLRRLLEKSYGDEFADLWFDQIKPLSKRFLVGEYYAYRNPSIAKLNLSLDLRASLYSPNWQERENKNLKSIRSRLAYLATKSKAGLGHQDKLMYDIMLHGIEFPKSIRKLLIGFPVQDKTYLENLQGLCRIYGVDTVRNFLNLYLEYCKKHTLIGCNFSGYISSAPRSRDYYFQDLSTVIEWFDLIGLGVPQSRVARFFDKQELKDTIAMLRRLNNHYVQNIEPENPNGFYHIDYRNLKTPQAIHDYVSLVYEETFHAYRDLATYRQPWVSTTPVFEHLSHIIRPIHQITELRQIGSCMRHCVGSYMSRQHEGQLEIFVLLSAPNKDENNYLVCIEVVNVSPKNRYINQAKMYCNAAVHQNLLFNDIVKMWAKENKFAIRTNDIQ